MNSVAETRRQGGLSFEAHADNSNAVMATMTHRDSVLNMRRLGME